MINTNFLNNQNYVGNKKEKDFVEKQFIEGFIFKYRIFAISFFSFLILILFVFFSSIFDYLSRTNISYNTIIFVLIGVFVFIIYVDLLYNNFIKNKYNSHVGKYIVYNKTYKSYVNSIMWNYLVVEKNNTKYYYSPYNFTINKEIKSDNIIADNGAYIIKLKNNHE